MRKHFVLDTNVLLHDPQGVLDAFAENHLVIPIVVTEELDRLKRDPIVGFEVREITRKLEDLRKGGNISEGVPTKGGGSLRIDANHADFKDLPLGFTKTPDNIILLVARGLQGQNIDKQEPVVLVTKDINLRLKANAMGLTAEDYESDKTASVDKLYGGIVTLPAEEADIAEIHRVGKLALPDTGLIAEHLRTKPPNVCCILQNGREDRAALALYKKKEGTLHLVKKPRKRLARNGGIAPRNDKQCMAYDLVMDEGISLVTLVGEAGTGKTLMALLAGVELLKKKKFKKMIVFRPNVEVGDPMGFLPGNITEKFEPWAKPVISCLNLALSGTDKTALDMMKKGELEIHPFNYIRGMTYMDSIVLVDESQNISPHVVKTAVTRMGERSKMVLTGDLKQIDSRFLDAQSNGLSHVIYRFPGQEIYGHLTLTKSERSVLAEIAARLL